MKAVTIVIFTITFLSTQAIDEELDDGKYKPDESGRYDPVIHDGGKYYHDDSGRYIPDYRGLYHPDGLGFYTGDNSGQYRSKYNRFRSNAGRFRPKYSKVVPTRKPISRSVDENEENLDDDFVVGFYSQDTKRSTNLVNHKPRYDGHWKIIRQAGGVENAGYKYLYETENKILAEEKAKVTNKGAKDESIESKGFYQYVGPDNVEYKLTYTADENGFIPKGDHLPRSLVRLLEYHKAQG